MIVWAIILGAMLLPFFFGVYAGYKGETPQPSNHASSDEENIKTTLLKQQVDLLDKNRRESWTSPNYFKK